MSGWLCNRLKQCTLRYWWFGYPCSSSLSTKINLGENNCTMLFSLIIFSCMFCRTERSSSLWAAVISARSVCVLFATALSSARMKLWYSVLKVRWHDVWCFASTEHKSSPLILRAKDVFPSFSASDARDCHALFSVSLLCFFVLPSIFISIFLQ